MEIDPFKVSKNIQLEYQEDEQTHVKEIPQKMEDKYDYICMYVVQIELVSYHITYFLQYLHCVIENKKVKGNKWWVPPSKWL